MHATEYNLQSQHKVNEIEREFIREKKNKKSLHSGN